MWSFGKYREILTVDRTEGYSIISTAVSCMCANRSRCVCWADVLYMDRVSIILFYQLNGIPFFVCMCVCVDGSGCVCLCVCGGGGGYARIDWRYSIF